MKQNAQLFVNDQPLDLFSSDQEPVQLVMQANDLGNIASVDANYTKRFNIPLTHHNKLVLGFPGEIYVFSKVNPYNFYPARLVYAGIEVIPSGKLLIMQVNNDTADVTVTSGNFDFMSLIGYQIYDMGDSLSPASSYGRNLVWKKWDIPSWDVPTVAGSQQNTSGWIWPIVNYGGIANPPNAAPYTSWVNVRNQRPAFFVKTALELLVQSTGYTIDEPNSCLYNSPAYYNLFSRMLIAFSNSDFQHGTDWQNSPAPADAMINNVLAAQFTFYPGRFSGSKTHAGPIPFSRQNYGPVTKNINGTVEVVFDLYLKGMATGNNPSTVYIAISVTQTLTNTSTVIAQQAFDLSTASTRLAGSGSSIAAQQTFSRNKISANVQLVPGMLVGVTYGVQDSLDTTFIVYSGATFEFIPSEQEVLFKQPVQCERILPDISQIDFLKFILQTFALTVIADPNAGMVRFVSFKQIVGNIPNARDWSNKVVNMGKQVTFNLGNYAQRNWLRYQYDNSIPLNYLPKYFADDHIDIADKTLSPSQPVQDLFVSPFGPSINVPYFGGTMAQICSPTNTSEFAVGNSPRILIDEKVDLRKLSKNPDGSAKTVTFADADQSYQTVTQVVNDIVSVPYFWKPDADPTLDPAPRHLSFSDKKGLPGLKSSYFKEFTGILTNSKKVVRYFKLSPMDIQNFDFSIPIYLRQDSAYYYVNRIDSWSFGSPVKVELIRL